MPLRRWIRVSSYEEARKFEGCVYVLKKNGRPIYVGKAKRFGGSGGRYAHGYSYLLDELLASRRYSLHLLRLSDYSNEAGDYEGTLISKAKGAGYDLRNARIPANFERIKYLRLP